MELAAIDAWAAEGVIPEADARECREKASFTVEAVEERERTTGHDVAAFVDVVAASIGDAGRWLHYGLTSYDVVDNALALQLQQAGEIIVARRPRLPRCTGRARARVRDALCVGRTHGVHAEPTTFGLRLAIASPSRPTEICSRLDGRLRAGRRRQGLRRGRDLCVGAALGRGAG